MPDKFQFMSIPTIHNLAADIAHRIPEMARDSAMNNAEVIESMLKPLYEAIENERTDSMLSKQIHE